MQTYTRKKCRFPAFDDDAGVKIVQTNQRVLFDGQDDLITSYRLEAKDIFERQLPKAKRNRRVSLDDEPRRELDHHKANLPKYHDHKESKKVNLCTKRPQCHSICTEICSFFFDSRYTSGCSITERIDESNGKNTSILHFICF